MNHFIVFDLEYTSWEGAQARQWSGENEYREIAQIGALKVDAETFGILDSLNVLVKPEKNPELSDYFQNLTNIRQSDLNREGVSFYEAYNRFIDFCGAALTFSYGNDMVIIGENIGLHHDKRRPYHRRKMFFVNLKPYISRIDPGSAEHVSGHLWQSFNLPKPHEADEHDALFDCYSILATIRHLTASGKSLPL